MANSLADQQANKRMARLSSLSGPDMELSDEYLARKFMRPAKAEEKITYEFTRDPGLLQQYYRLREEMFISVWGLQHFSGQKDAFDDQSDIVVARIGNLCIGGCRLSYNYPGTDRLLPMEREGFRLRDVLPDLNLDEVMVGEISRMAILPEYQNSLVIVEIIRQLFKRGAERKARFGVSMSPIMLARNYRKAVSLFGLNWEIRRDVKIPEREEFEGIKMMLSTIDLAPAYQAKPLRALAKEKMSDSLLAV